MGIMDWSSPPSPVLRVTPAGLALAVAGSLWIPIVLHVLVEFVGSLLGPRVLGSITGNEIVAALAGVEVNS